MDSFYDGPRRPPVPTAIEKINRIPSVPEISVVETPSFRTHGPANSDNFDSLYQTGNFFKMSSVAAEEVSVFASKKQVRFKTAAPPVQVESSDNPCNFFHMNKASSNKENVPGLRNLEGKTFKQIYMANVPNRHLDLSILEPPTTNNVDTFKKTNLEKLPKAEESKLSQIPENYDRPLAEVSKSHEFNKPEFLFNKMTEPQQYIRNRQFHDYSTTRAEFDTRFNPTIPYRDNCLKSIENTNCNQVSDTSKALEVPKPPSSDEPTMKDLFKLIQKQNEQILMLQQQVNSLKTTLHPEVPPPEPEFRNSPRKGMSKFSIDLKATSFEVSFRPQTNKFRKQNDFFEPKIQEILEDTQRDDGQNISLNLEESLHVKDNYVSPVPSIKINMEDYVPSDDEEENSESNPGGTFYRDLMDQVNNVLKKMQVQSECHNYKKGEAVNQTLNAVKQATLQHLKNIGVNLPPIQESSENISEQSNSYSPSEVSFAVKQLLMKYLPDDKLMQALNRPKQLPKIMDKRKTTPGNAEFSFATMQYMKKYNIIDSQPRPARKMGDNPKILDVTALKMQPKLL